MVQMAIITAMATNKAAMGVINMIHPMGLGGRGQPFHQWDPFFYDISTAEGVNDMGQKSL